MTVLFFSVEILKYNRISFALECENYADAIDANEFAGLIQLVSGTRL